MLSCSSCGAWLPASASSFPGSGSRPSRSVPASQDIALTGSSMSLERSRASRAALVSRAAPPNALSMAWSEALAGRYRNRVEMRVPTSNGLAASPWPIHKNPCAQGVSGSTFSSRSYDCNIIASPSTAGTTHAQVLMVKPPRLNIYDNCKRIVDRDATGYSPQAVGLDPPQIGIAHRERAVE